MFPPSTIKTEVSNDEHCSVFIHWLQRTEFVPSRCPLWVESPYRRLSDLILTHPTTTPPSLSVQVPTPHSSRPVHPFRLPVGVVTVVRCGQMNGRLLSETISILDSNRPRPPLVVSRPLSIPSILIQTVGRSLSQTHTKVPKSSSDLVRSGSRLLPATYPTTPNLNPSEVAPVLDFLRRPCPVLGPKSATKRT